MKCTTNVNAKLAIIQLSHSVNKAYFSVSKVASFSAFAALVLPDFSTCILSTCNTDHARVIFSVEFGHRDDKHMISPELQNYRTRVRLRDNADPLDCLDLSRQSSSLLSPSLHPHFDGSELENIFPFRVSPIESSSRSKLHINTGRQAHSTWQGANTASGPLSPLTNIDPISAQASPSTVNLPASEPLTPPAGPHPVQDEVRCSPLYASLITSL